MPRAAPGRRYTLPVSSREDWLRRSGRSTAVPSRSCTRRRGDGRPRSATSRARGLGRRARRTDRPGRVGGRGGCSSAPDFRRRWRAIVGLAMLSLASAALVERGLAERFDRWQGQARSADPMSRRARARVRDAGARRGGRVVDPSHWFGVFVATAVAGRWAAVFLQALGDPIARRPRRRARSSRRRTPPWLDRRAQRRRRRGHRSSRSARAGIIAMALGRDRSRSRSASHAQRRDRGLSAPGRRDRRAIGELVVLLAASLRRYAGGRSSTSVAPQLPLALVGEPEAATAGCRSSTRVRRSGAACPCPCRG